MKNLENEIYPIMNVKYHKQKTHEGNMDVNTKEICVQSIAQPTPLYSSLDHLYLFIYYLFPTLIL